jgi:hypothetical protein
MILEQLQGLWVKTSDRLPEKDGFYWVTNMHPKVPESPSVNTASFFEGAFWSTGGGPGRETGNYQMTVTHWAVIVKMPLPLL